MQVDRICSHNIATIARGANLVEAAQLMRRMHVGALVVVADEPAEIRRAVGIVTDRDLVLQAMANGVGPQDATVAEVMTEGLAAVPQNADVFEAIEAMQSHGVRRLAVSNAEGALVGVVSLDDVIGVLGTELGTLAATLSKEMATEREAAQRAPVMMAIG